MSTDTMFIRGCCSAHVMKPNPRDSIFYYYVDFDSLDP